MTASGWMRVIVGVVGACVWTSALYAYDAKGKRDPFVALIGADGVLRMPKAAATGPAKSSSGRLVLEGIVYDPVGGSFAIINGGLYRIGDSVGDAEVAAIEPSHVIVSQRGREQTLWLPGVESTEGSS